jgi:hypothetical protein
MSPVVYDRLSRGTHEFTGRSTDAAGNTGESNLLGLSTIHLQQHLEDNNKRRYSSAGIYGI